MFLPNKMLRKLKCLFFKKRKRKTDTLWHVPTVTTAQSINNMNQFSKNQDVPNVWFLSHQMNGNDRFCNTQKGVCGIIHPFIATTERATLTAHHDCKNKAQRHRNTNNWPTKIFFLPRQEKSFKNLFCCRTQCHAQKTKNKTWTRNSDTSLCLCKM